MHGAGGEQGVRGAGGAASSPRPGRAPGDDAWAVDDARGLWAVADGLGQYRGGDVASALVVEAARAALADPPAEATAEAPRAWLGRAATAAARALHARGLAAPGLGSMATTLTLVRLVAGRAWALHVGDARAYRLRAGALALLTRDHSVAWEQHEAGAFPRDRVRGHPNQRLLTRTLIARRDHVVPDVLPLDLAPGDALLLCTDGVWRALDEAALCEVLCAALAGPGPPEAAARRVVDAARAAGSDDDATAVVVRIA